MILSKKHHKYRVANLGNNCFCLTTSDLKTAVIEPISDEDLKNEINNSAAVNSVTKTNMPKLQASQTEKALMNATPAQSVKPEKKQTPQTPEAVNRALWAEQTPGFGFFWLGVLFVFTLIAAPALGH